PRIPRETPSNTSWENSEPSGDKPAGRSLAIVVPSARIDTLSTPPVTPLEEVVHALALGAWHCRALSARSIRKRKQSANAREQAAGGHHRLGHRPAVHHRAGAGSPCGTE